MNRIAEAAALALELHASQVRKATGVPYASHLFQVCGMVLEDGGDEDEVVAALLHDAAEDQGGRATLAMIRDRFGDRVAEIVAGCSDAMPERGERKAPWRERKEAYMAHLREADASVLRLALADRLQNGRSLLADLAAQGPTVWQHFNAPPADEAWFYRSVLEVCAQRSPTSWNLPAFRQVVAQISAAAEKAQK